MASKWTPVNDKLPPVHEHVLVFADGECHVCYMLLAGEWGNPTFEREDMKVIDCTHWMPLPALPTDTQEGDDE